MHVRSHTQDSRLKSKKKPQKYIGIPALAHALVPSKHLIPLYQELHQRTHLQTDGR